METWQRLSFVLICCVITLVIMKKKQVSAEKVVNYKEFICIINFILCCIFFIRDDIPVTLSNLFSLTFIGFSLFIWNHWLYMELFDEEKATFRIQYRSFEMIGLLAAVSIFSLLFLEALGIRV